MLEAFANFIKDVLLWAPLKFMEWLLDLLIGLLEDMPVPAFFTQAKSAFSSVPPDVVYFISPFEVTYGISVLLSAYVIRFIIRRIPIIG